MPATSVSLRMQGRTVPVWLSKARPNRFIGNTLKTFAGRPTTIDGWRHPANRHDPAPMCAAQARPAPVFGHRKLRVEIRFAAASPVSPEGDHFPRTPDAGTYVFSQHPAPAPSRRHACRCIRGWNAVIIDHRFGTRTAGDDFSGKLLFLYGVRDEVILAPAGRIPLSRCCEPVPV